MSEFKKPPCEFFGNYVAPTVRMEIAKYLLHLGMNQTEASNLLNITQPAISQYVNNLRSDSVVFSDKVNDLIYDLAKGLFEGYIGKDDLVMNICTICASIRMSDVLIRRSNMNLDHMCPHCL